MPIMKPFPSHYSNSKQANSGNVSSIPPIHAVNRGHTLEGQPYELHGHSMAVLRTRTQPEEARPPEATAVAAGR